MKSPLFSPGSLCAAALVVSACVSLEDLPRAEPDADASESADEADADEGSGDDGDPSDATRRDRDAAREPPDAGTDELDATMPAPVFDGSTSPCTKQFICDSGPTDEGGFTVDPVEDTGPTQPACRKASDCGADQTCSVGQCVPRCTSYGACVVYEGEAERRISDMFSTEDAVYWRLAATSDALGNPRRDAELWRKTPGSSALLIAKDVGRGTVLFRGGFVYFQDGLTIKRAALQADAPSQSLYSIAPDAFSWTVSDSIVAFGTPQGIVFGSIDGSAPLRTIALQVPNSTPVNVAAQGDRIYFLIGSRENSYASSVRAVEPFTIETTVLPGESVTPSTTFRGGQAVYPCGPVYQWICAATIADGRVVTAAAPPDEFWTEEASQGRGYGGFVAGNWVYYQMAIGNSKPGTSWLVVRRFSLISIGTSQDIFKRGESYVPTPSASAASGDRFYFAPPAPQGLAAPIVYEMQLQAEPCAQDLPCPTGKSCGADMLCH